MARDKKPWLSPAIRLMNWLTFPQKFALISIFFAIPLVLVLYFLNAQQFQNATAAALDSNSRLWDRAARQFKVVLHHRIDSLQRELFSLVGVSLAAFWSWPASGSRFTAGSCIPCIPCRRRPSA